MHFFDASTGWLVGNGGAILKSADGARSWVAQTSGTAQTLNSVHFASTSIGGAAGNAGTLCNTINGGTAWACQTKGAANLRGINLPSTAVAYALGDSGKIWNSTNMTVASPTWAAQTSNTTQQLKGVDFTATTTGYATGGLETVMGTTNSGTTWAAQTSGTKAFDTLLTYKYLKPGTSHTILLDAMIRYALPLKGYQKSITLNIPAGKDTTVTPNSNLTKCGYGGVTPTCQ